MLDDITQRAARWCCVRSSNATPPNNRSGLHHFIQTRTHMLALVVGLAPAVASMPTESDTIILQLNTINKHDNLPDRQTN